MIVHNEMNRTLAILNHKKSRQTHEKEAFWQ
jgi:hypothetical protein